MKRLIITGGLHAGKSTLALDLTLALSREGKRVAGILARGLWRDGLREGFDLVNLATGAVVPLARRTGLDTAGGGTPYRFLEPGLEEGRRALDPALCGRADLVLVDEIGPLELKGMGWANEIRALASLKKPIQAWVVRQSLVDRVRAAWPADRERIVAVHDPHALETLTRFCLE